jgi:tripartite-type tricarboxylate transporter receptor subunit TctC
MKGCKLLMAMTLALFGASAAVAQNYPNKPIRIIVSTSPGGVTDFLARILGAHITAKSGQPHVIDNRSGGSGNIAMDALSKSPADGYTVGFANTGNIVINPYLFKTMTFDPLNDLVPVGPVGTVPLFLVVNSKVPAQNLQEFLAYAKANPDKVSYAGAGAGTTPDLAQSEFARRSGVKLVVVPYKGTGPATTAIIGGDVNATFVSMGPHIEFVRNGTLRVLAAATPKRMPYVPDVPTFAEQGFPGFEAQTWFGMFAPRGTPPEILQRLNEYARTVHDDPDMKRRVEASFVDPLVETQPQFAERVKTDAVNWERIVRESGVKID